MIISSTKIIAVLFQVLQNTNVCFSLVFSCFLFETGTEREEKETEIYLLTGSLSRCWQ